MCSVHKYPHFISFGMNFYSVMCLGGMISFIFVYIVCTHSQSCRRASGQGLSLTFDHCLLIIWQVFCLLPFPFKDHMQNILYVGYCTMIPKANQKQVKECTTGTQGCVRSFTWNYYLVDILWLLCFLPVKKWQQVDGGLNCP